MMLAHLIGSSISMYPCSFSRVMSAVADDLTCSHFEELVFQLSINSENIGCHLGKLSINLAGFSLEATMPNCWACSLALHGFPLTL